MAYDLSLDLRVPAWLRGMLATLTVRAERARERGDEISFAQHRTNAQALLEIAAPYIARPVRGTTMIGTPMSDDPQYSVINLEEQRSGAPTSPSVIDNLRAAQEEAAQAAQSSSSVKMGAVTPTTTGAPRSPDPTAPPPTDPSGPPPVMNPIGGASTTGDPLRDALLEDAAAAGRESATWYESVTPQWGSVGQQQQGGGSSQIMRAVVFLGIGVGAYLLFTRS